VKAAGFGVAVALLALATLSAAPQRPTFSSGILAVRVDAQVMDGRRPVPGLRAEDFVVLDTTAWVRATRGSHSGARPSR